MGLYLSDSSKLSGDGASRFNPDLALQERIRREYSKPVPGLDKKGDTFFAAMEHEWIANYTLWGLHSPRRWYDMNFQYRVCSMLGVPYPDHVECLGHDLTEPYVITSFFRQPDNSHFSTRLLVPTTIFSSRNIICNGVERLADDFCSFEFQVLFGGLPQLHAFCAADHPLLEQAVFDFLSVIDNFYRTSALNPFTYLGLRGRLSSILKKYDLGHS